MKIKCLQSAFNLVSGHPRGIQYLLVDFQHKHIHVHVMRSVALEVGVIRMHVVAKTTYGSVYLYLSVVLDLSL